MKCQTCGSENLDSAKFCASCGSKIFPQESAFKDLTPPPPPIAPSFNESAFSQRTDSPFREIPPAKDPFANPVPPQQNPYNQNPYNQNPYNQSGSNSHQTPPQGSPYGQYNSNDPNNNHYQIQAANKDANTALVLGILSFICSGSLIFSILALVFGSRAKNTLTSLGQPTGTATAGIVLGVIGIIFSIIAIFVLVPLMMSSMY